MRMRCAVLALAILFAPGVSLAQETLVASYPDTSTSAFCQFLPAQPFAGGAFFFGSCRPRKGFLSDSQIAVPFHVPAFSRMQPTRFAAAMRGLLTQSAAGRVRLYADAGGKPDLLLGDFSIETNNLSTQSAPANVCPSGPLGAAVLAQFTPVSPPVLENNTASPRRFWVVIQGAAGFTGFVPTLLSTTTQLTYPLFLRCDIGPNIDCFSDCTADQVCSASHPSVLPVCYDLAPALQSQWTPIEQYTGGIREQQPHLRVYGVVTAIEIVFSNGFE